MCRGCSFRHAQVPTERPQTAHSSRRIKLRIGCPCRCLDIRQKQLEAIYFRQSEHIQMYLASFDPNAVKMLTNDRVGNLYLGFVCSWFGHGSDGV